ncbi:hypothetical protein DW921_05600 [Phocaeicola coprophilus]|uniref:Uncharacterized protein n=1 Tax=Phocaeicola coprophilus TaxID=387090 RepID=A0A413T1Y3_9BACT|nr:hypothetical protein DW921_05600 [Phocaeicola coprophilus]
MQIYEKSVSLHRVFHSIRFKVNKGWSTAVLLFYAHTFTSSSQPAFTPLFLRSGIHSGFPFFARQQARRCENIRQTMP